MDIWITTTYHEGQTWVVGLAVTETLAKEIGEASVLNDELPGYPADDPHYAQGYKITKMRVATR